MIPFFATISLLNLQPMIESNYLEKPDSSNYQTEQTSEKLAQINFNYETGVFFLEQAKKDLYRSVPREYCTLFTEPFIEIFGQDDVPISFAQVEQFHAELLLTDLSKMNVWTHVSEKLFIAEFHLRTSEYLRQILRRA